MDSRLGIACLAKINGFFPQSSLQTHEAPSSVVFKSEFTRSERRDGRPSARAGGHGQQKSDVVTDDSCFDVSRSTNITMEDKRSTHAHSDGISWNLMFIIRC
ncbi:hypothetical protein J6590_049688 [Homalodisca vitripennis]|nr:hypothetical protein J6590_049688 [Homalodisca vitripennis]